MAVDRFVVVSLVDERVEAEVSVHVLPANSDGRAVALAAPPPGGGWTFKWTVRGRATAHAIERRVHATPADAANAAKDAIVAYYREKGIRARLDPETKAPILLLQWGPASEFDEIAYAMSVLGYTLAARGSVEPNCQSERVHDEDPAAFLRALERRLLEHRDVQVVYVSAHGLVDRICYSAVMGAPSFPFAELRGPLTNGLQASDVTLVLGMCKALNAQSTWLPSIPRSVSRIAGFTESPFASEVAGLLAGILLDDVDRFEAYSAANSDVFGEGVKDGELDAAVEKLNAGLVAADAQLQEAPGRLVRKKSNGELRVVERDDRAAWQARTIPY